LTDKTREDIPFRVIGIIGRSCGLKGKFFITEPGIDAQAFRSLKYIYVGNGAEPEDVFEILDVEERSGRLCLQLENVGTRDLAEQIKHWKLFITGEQAKNLVKDDTAEAYAYKGYRVLQDGEFLGVVTGTMTRPGQDILIFEDKAGRPIMLPFVDAFIEAIDTKAGIVHVHLLEGMMHED
jgi:16S rRNA processing protein RimM